MHEEKKDDQGLKNRGPEDKKNLRRPQMKNRHTNRRAQQKNERNVDKGYTFA
jgi:hypothetical protein